MVSSAGDATTHLRRSRSSGVAASLTSSSSSSSSSASKERTKKDDDVEERNFSVEAEIELKREKNGGNVEKKT